jgi:hypothetical protein
MSFALDDLTTPTTVEEAKSSIYSVLGILGVSTTDWRPGAVVRTIITAFAVLFAGATSLIAMIARGGFLALAASAWLTLVAKYVYGVDRNPATYATGPVTLTNAGGGVYSLNAGELQLLNPVTLATYRNTAPINIPALATVTATIKCDQQGAFGTSEAGAITGIQAPSLAGVTASNAAALVGQDEEEDEALRTRCSEKLGALSPNGAPDAYAYVARNALRLDGSGVGVNRVQVVRNGTTTLDVYTATPTGAVTGTIGDLTTDLGAVDEAIQTQVVPIPLTANVHSAAAVMVPITYAAYIYNTAGLTAAQAQGYIAAALADLFSSQTLNPIGGNAPLSGVGYMYRTAIEGAIASAAGAGGARLPIYRVDLTGLGDVAVNVGQVLVPGIISGTIVFTAPQGL